jgi:1,2-diacylglycerol 3-beta-galactosyltransferase
MNARRILILTADAGFGHRSAANAIAAALTERHGADSVIEVVNALADERVPAFLRNTQADYDRIVRDVPRLYKLGYDASDASVPSSVLERALTLLLFEVLRDLVRRYQPDCIVTTYPLYQAPLGTVFALGQRSVPLLTVVTDLATVHRIWFYKGSDLCLVPTSAVQALAYEAGLGALQVRVTGIPVHPAFARQERSRASRRVELGWRPDMTTVLVVGSKRVGGLSEVLRTLNHAGLPLQLAVVTGGDEALYQQLQEITWHIPAHIYGFVQNMPTLMQAADCVVCKAGGLIVTEALACGLPLLLVDVLPGQEMGNADYVVTGGAGILAPHALDVLETLYHWLASDGALLMRHASQARQLGRPRAAYDVADLAWEAAVRGPRLRYKSLSWQWQRLRHAGRRRRPLV